MGELSIGRALRLPLTVRTDRDELDLPPSDLPGLQAASVLGEDRLGGTSIPHIDHPPTDLANRVAVGLGVGIVADYPVEADGSADQPSLGELRQVLVEGGEAGRLAPAAQLPQHFLGGEMLMGFL